MLKASTSVTRTASEFMDCQAGAFNLCLGYRHPVAVQAIKDRADKLIHVSSSYQTHPINEMTSILAELAPAGLNASPTTSTRYSAGMYGICPGESTNTLPCNSGRTLHLGTRKNRKHPVRTQAG